MTRVLTAVNLLAGGLACLLVSAELSVAREPGTEALGIPGQKITALHEALAEAGKASLATAKRRACKGVIKPRSVQKANSYQ